MRHKRKGDSYVPWSLLVIHMVKSGYFAACPTTDPTAS